MGFAFVDGEPVVVRIVHDRVQHIGLSNGSKTNFTPLDRSFRDVSLKIVDFEGGGHTSGTGRPLLFAACNHREAAGSDIVLNPLVLAVVLPKSSGFLQTENAFIETFGPFHVRHGIADKRNLPNFHTSIVA